MSLLSLLFVAGCAGKLSRPSSPPTAEIDRAVIPKALPAVADRTSYDAMVKSARQWQRKAASVQGEWRDVESLLQQASLAAQAGDYQQAVELAEYARFQAEMGYRQMDSQRDVGNPSFLYY